jgi:hypothetical protein
MRRSKRLVDTWHTASLRMRKRVQFHAVPPTTCNGLFGLCSYFERAIRMAFSARAMRFVTISPAMRKLAAALFQTVVPILTVLGFCEWLSDSSATVCLAAAHCQPHGMGTRQCLDGQRCH